MNKILVKQLIAKGELESALEVMLAEAEKEGFSTLFDEIVIQSSQFEELEKEERSGGLAFEDAKRARVQISKSLLEIISNFPEDLEEEEAQKRAKSKGIPERKLKKLVFAFLVIAKFFIIAYVFFHWNTGGFNKGEMLAAISLLVPVFVTYISVIINEYVALRYVPEDGQTPDRLINRSFQTITYVVFPLYVLLLAYVIGLKPQGIVSFEEMNAWLAAIESCFGVYVGRIVFALFRRGRLVSTFTE